MTPYNHLRSQHRNASWRGNLCILLSKQHTQHLTHSGWVWPCGSSKPSRVETFLRSHPESTFQVYKHFDLTRNRTPVAWIEIQSANDYTTDPLCLTRKIGGFFNYYGIVICRWKFHIYKKFSVYFSRGVI